LFGEGEVGKTCILQRCVGEPFIEGADVHALLFVYDIFNLESWEHIPHTFEQISQAQKKIKIKFIVGNKIDLLKDQERKKTMRKS